MKISGHWTATVTEDGQVPEFEVHSFDCCDDTCTDVPVRGVSEDPIQAWHKQLAREDDGGQMWSSPQVTVDQARRCPAHGENACWSCSRIAEVNLTSEGGCKGCEYWGETGMHWDTCQHRIRGKILPPEGAERVEIERLRKQAQEVNEAFNNAVAERDALWDQLEHVSSELEQARAEVEQLTEGNRSLHRYADDLNRAVGCASEVLIEVRGLLPKSIAVEVAQMIDILATARNLAA